MFGLITAILAISIFYVFSERLHFHYLLANSFSIIIAILFSYIVTKRCVFKTKTETLKQTFREFILFVAVKMPASLLNMLGLFF